jgi:DNA-binding MarR family transcriptional regulator
MEEFVMPRGPDTTFEDFVKLWRDTAHYIWGRHHSVREDYGLSPSQLVLLWHLQALGPLHLTELKAFIPGYLSAVGQMVDRMVKTGWITRQRSTTDRRKVLVNLTEKAVEALSDIDPFGPARAIRELNRMGKKEKRKALDALRLLSSLMGVDGSGDDEA